MAKEEKQAALEAEEVKEELPPQEAPQAEAPAQEAPEAQEEHHKLSNNACRWIYFVLTLALLGVMALVQINHSIITVYQWTFDVDGTLAFINGMSSWFSSGVQTGIQAMMAVALLALTLAGTIIFIVRFILLLISFFSFLKLEKNRMRLHFKFRKAMRQVAKVAGFYLLVDFIFIALGAGAPKGMVIDIAVIAAMFGLSSLNYWCYETFNRHGKFSVSVLILELCNVALYAFMGVMVGIYLSRNEFLQALIDGINTASASSGSSVDPKLFIYPAAALSFGVVGTIFGVNIITKTAYYYPHNDVGRKTKYALVQKKNLVSSILFTVFFAIVAVTKFLGGAQIMDLIVPVLLIPVMVLAMSICLKVAYNLDNPKGEDD